MDGEWLAGMTGNGLKAWLAGSKKRTSLIIQTGSTNSLTPLIPMAPNRGAMLVRHGFDAVSS